MILKKKKNCIKCNTFQYIFSKGRCKKCSTYTPNKKYDTKKVHAAMLEYWECFGEYKRCKGCNTLLPLEFSTAFVDHLLPKSVYPQLALDKNNFFLCCIQCHNLKEKGCPTEKHKLEIERIKNEIRTI